MKVACMPRQCKNVVSWFLTSRFPWSLIFGVITKCIPCIYGLYGLGVQSTELKLLCFWSSVSVWVTVMTPMSLSKTLNHDASSFDWDVKPLVSCVVLCTLKEPSALIVKRRGSPRCSWFDWQHIAPQHLAVNHDKVLCERSRSQNSNVVHNTLEESTECWSTLRAPWGSLSDGYKCYIRSHH